MFLKIKKRLQSMAVHTILITMPLFTRRQSSGGVSIFIRNELKDLLAV